MLDLPAYPNGTHDCWRSYLNASGCEGLRHPRGSPARIDRTNSGHPREPTPPAVVAVFASRGEGSSYKAIDPASIWAAVGGTYL